MGEVGEGGDGAVLPGATDEPTTVLSVSAQEVKRKRTLVMSSYNLSLYT